MISFFWLKFLNQMPKSTINSIIGEIRYIPKNHHSNLFASQECLIKMKTWFLPHQYRMKERISHEHFLVNWIYKQKAIVTLNQFLWRYFEIDLLHNSIMGVCKHTNMTQIAEELLNKSINSKAHSHFSPTFATVRLQAITYWGGQR